MKTTEKWALVTCTALVAGCLSTDAGRAANYLESASGDISSNPQMPMEWALEPGANSINGTAGGNFFAGLSDYDLISFTVPLGYKLDSVKIDAYLNIDEFSQSFIGLQAGSPWLDAVGWDIQGNWLLAWMHLENSSPGTDMLQKLLENAISADYKVPLDSGVYTMLVEDVDTVMTYGLTFHVSAVPEPAAATLVAVGALALLRRRQQCDVAMRR
jgi:MYXO-CTERM domain-containing protein